MKIQMLLGLGLSVMSSLAFADSQLLAGCKVGGEEIKLELTGQGFAAVRFAGQETTVYSASRSRVVRNDTAFLETDLYLANGRVVNVLRDPQTGSLQIWDRKVAYGPCDAGTEEISEDALDDLLTHFSKPQPLFQFADCTGENGDVTSITVRKGADLGSLVFEGDLPDSRGGEHLVYVAYAYATLNGLGHFNVRFQGEGAFIYSALGSKSSVISKFELQIPSIGEISLKIVTESGYITRLLSGALNECQINNLDLVKSVLANKDPE